MIEIKFEVDNYRSAAYDGDKLWAWQNFLSPTIFDYYSYRN